MNNIQRQNNVNPSILCNYLISLYLVAMPTVNFVSLLTFFRYLISFFEVVNLYYLIPPLETKDNCKKLTQMSYGVTTKLVKVYVREDYITLRDYFLKGCRRSLYQKALTRE